MDHHAPLRPPRPSPSPGWLPKPPAGRRPPWVLALLLLAGCPRPATPPPALPASTLAALDLPPSEGALPTVRALSRERSCAARWAHARYALDLLDAAHSLAGEADEVSPAQRRAQRPVHTVLGAALRLANLDALDGPARARRALRRLLRAIPRRCTQASSARRALRLLSLDRLPDTPGPAALKKAVGYKRIAALAGPLAVNARWRLAQWCVRAFRHAARLVPRRQQARINRCLYPLFDADPSPYFQPDPAARPPDPPWTVLRQRLAALLRRQRASRFGALARLQLAADDAFFLEAQSSLPAAIDLHRQRLITSDQGIPCDRTPVVTITPTGFLVDNIAVADGARALLRQAINRRMVGDRRKALFVVARPRTSLHPLFQLGRAARKIGLLSLYLGVRRKVATAVPGDVQRLIARGRDVYRLEGLPISIRLLSLRAGTVDRDRPRQLAFDPRTARERLALTVDSGRLRLCTRDGQHAVPQRALLGWLRIVRRAFPAEESFVLAPKRATLFGRLVHLVQRLRYHQRRPLFPALALASFHDVVPPAREIGPLLRALAGARIAVLPRAAASTRLVAALRRCYRAALRRAVASGETPPAARLRFGPGGVLVRDPKRDGHLSRCVRAAVTAAQARPRAVTFSPGTPQSP